MLSKMKNLVKEEQGQGMTEYGLLLAVVVVVVAAGCVLFNKQLTALIKSVTDSLAGAIEKATATPQ